MTGTGFRIHLDDVIVEADTFDAIRMRMGFKETCVWRCIAADRRRCYRRLDADDWMFSNVSFLEYSEYRLFSSRWVVR